MNFKLLFLVWLQAIGLGFSSLTAQQLSSISDSSKTLRFVEKSNNYLDENTDSALVFANIGLQAAKDINDLYLIALAKDQVAQVLMQSGKWKKAIKLFDQSIQIRERNNWLSEAGQSYVHLGSLYLSEGEMFELRESFDNADKSYALALKNYRLAQNLFTQLQDTLWTTKVHLNIGAAHYRLYQNDSALIHFKKSITLYTKINAPEKIPMAYSNIGLIYHSMGQLDSAEIYYSNAQLLFVREANIKNWINANINLAALYEELNPQKVIPLLLQADSLANAANFIVQQAAVQEFLYKVYIDLKNDNLALRYLEKYVALKDKILNSEFKTEELQVRFQTAKQKELIERQKADNLKKELALSKAAAEKNRMQIIVVTTAILLLLTFAILYWRHSLMKKLQSQKEKLHQQELHELEQTKKLEAAKAMLAGQEKERIRIAEDLHDRLGSTLIATRMQFEVGMDNLDKVNKYLSKAQLLLDQAINDSREISHNMISGVLVKLGLKAALSELKNGLESTGQLSFNLSLNELEKLSGNTEIQLFRIIQELINNAIRHANATIINIAFVQNTRQNTFIIKNNGKGFNPKAKTKGIGLRNINSRVTTFGGTFLIESDTIKGTTCTIQFPVNEA